MEHLETRLVQLLLRYMSEEYWLGVLGSVGAEDWISRSFFGVHDVQREDANGAGSGQIRRFCVRCSRQRVVRRLDVCGINGRKKGAGPQ